MSPFHDPSDYARRSCLWTFGMLVLIGLAACGASDQPAAADRTSVDPAQQASAVPELASPSVPPTPTTSPRPSAQIATPALRPRPSAAPALPKPIKPSIVAAAPTAAVIGPSGWQSYRHAQVGFSVAYPPDWAAGEQSSEGGTFITLFTPSGGPGIRVAVQAGAPPSIRQPESSSRVCESVVVGRLSGTRCFDTKAETTATTLVDKGYTYIIATTGRGVDARIYQQFLDSFAPTDG